MNKRMTMLTAAVIAAKSGRTVVLMLADDEAARRAAEDIAKAFDGTVEHLTSPGGTPMHNVVIGIAGGGVGCIRAHASLPDGNVIGMARNPWGGDWGPILETPPEPEVWARHWNRFCGP